MKLNHLNLRIPATILFCCSIFIGLHAQASYEIDGGDESVTITPTNSISTNVVFVGRYTSDNSLTITNGGFVNADIVNVGTVEPSGDNTLLVTGSNSTLLATTMYL